MNKHTAPTRVVLTLANRKARVSDREIRVARGTGAVLLMFTGSAVAFIGLVALAMFT